MKQLRLVFKHLMKQVNQKVGYSFIESLSSLFFVVLASMMLVSCGTTKTISKVEDASTNELITFHQAAMPQFETLAGRVQLAYETEKKSQRITVSLRMKKDEAIWIKASILGITLAKVLITPESVSYYETIDHTYFEGDFRLLGDWLGTSINFQQAQNLLLGQSIFNLQSSTYTSEIFKNKFKVQPKKQPQNFIHSIFLNANNFKVALETLAQPEQDRILNIRYGAYQMIEKQFFPVDISIVSTEEQSQTKIEMTYKKIDLNVDISFPFDIPEGYERIQL